MKKKTKRIGYFWVVLVVALGAFVFAFFVYRTAYDRVLSYRSNENRSANGNSNGNRNGNNYNNDDDDDEDDDDDGNNKYHNQYPSPAIVLPTINITPISVQPTLIQTTTAPVVPLVTPTENLQNNNIDNSSSVFQEYIQDTGYQQEVVVPVSERSVVSAVNINRENRVIAPTKSIFKKIENKIKGVGGSGQFLSRPKSTTTPTPTKKEDDFSPPVALGPDSSIFYMLTDTDLLLGAVDKEDKRINVDEAELRGAEITMDKVLKKKGLDLGMSSDGSLVLTENGVRAYFELPVFVDVFNHDISLNTTEGRKEIKVTPAKAIVSAIESGYLESVDSQAQMTLGVRDGQLVYRLQGDKEFNIFGRFNTKGVQYVYVGVDNGEVTEGDQPLLSRFMKLISL